MDCPSPSLTQTLLSGEDIGYGDNGDVRIIRNIKIFSERYVGTINIIKILK